MKRIKEFFEKPSVAMAIRPILVFSILCICLGLFLHSYKPVLIIDDNMAEMLKINDLIFVSKQAYASRDIRFGDVVLHDSGIPDGSGGYYQYCNRVIGLPGDKIRIKDAIVNRNGVELDEPYVTRAQEYSEMDQFIVPDGCYFMLSDNRAISIDSRYERIGFITKDQIRGRVVFRILPISRTGNISLQ